MKGLDRWITGNWGEDNNKPVCDSCEDAPVYRRGVCRDCHEALSEDAADARREMEREDALQARDRDATDRRR